MKKILFYTLFIFANTASASCLKSEETCDASDLPSVSPVQLQEVKLTSEEIFVYSPLSTSSPMPADVDDLIKTLKKKYQECYNIKRNEGKITHEELSQFLKVYENDELFRSVKSLTMLPSCLVNKIDNTICPEVSQFKIESIYPKRIKASIIYLLKNADRVLLLNGHLRIMEEVKSQGDSLKTENTSNGEIDAGKKRKSLDKNFFSDPTPLSKKSKNSE